MDAYEATKIVFSRIQSLDPENASKIMGLLLIQDHGDKEMIRLAFGPESLLHSLVLKAKKELGLVPNSTPSTPLSPSPFFSSSRHHHNNTNNNLTNTSNIVSTSSSCVSSASSSSCVSSASSSSLSSSTSSSSSSSTTRLGIGSHLPHSLSMPSASWAAAPPFLRGVGTVCDRADDSRGCRNQIQAEDPLISPNSSASCPINVGPHSHTHSFSSSSNSTSSSPFYTGGGDLIDELQLQDQLSFLNDSSFGRPSKINSLTGSGQDPLFFPPESPASPGEGGMFFPYTATWGPSGTQHRRSCSLADVDLLAAGAGGTGFGWKPCLYYARGYCKNGTSCRFLHGLPDPSPDAAAAKQMDGVVDHCQELLRSRSQRLGASTQLMSPPSPASFPLPNSSKCMNFLLQQQHQHNDSQRAVAAAAAALMRMERSDFAGPGMVNPGSRQIYLTFPADSTFREEDVSNYFSIYGPVQDVRIPYQQKRMFGFVTFVYPETVKLILAKGNPHFVCDARVLVKPYKEKGKVPDKYRKQQQQAERGDSSAMPTGLDPRDLYDLQQLGARMLYNNSQEMVLRRKLEEQQADLQHALELQGRRLMGLQLLDVKRRNLSTNSPLPSPDSFNRIYRGSPDLIQESSPSPAASISPSADNESCFNDSRNGDWSRNPDEFQESVEHNLPDSPFASPTKCSGDTSSMFSSEAAAAAASSTGDRSSAAVNSATTSTDNLIAASSLFPATSTLDIGSFKSCFFQMPRLSSAHGAIEM